MTNFWTTKAYLIPDTPFANVVPGQQGVKMIPINRMLPRSFFTNVQDGARAQGWTSDDRCGESHSAVIPDWPRCLFSSGCREPHGRKRGSDRITAKYSFRRWEVPLRLSSRGPHKLMVKAINTAGYCAARSRQLERSGLHAQRRSSRYPCRRSEYLGGHNHEYELSQALLRSGRFPSC